MLHCCVMVCYVSLTFFIYSIMIVQSLLKYNDSSVFVIV